MLGLDKLYFHTLLVQNYFKNKIKHELSRIFRIGIILQVSIKKAVEKYFFDRFFDATMLDITWLKTQSLRLY